MHSMRHLVYSFSILLLSVFLYSCGGTAPPSNAVTGPFNSRGDYIEDWVDKPHKWYKPPAPTEQTGQSSTQIAQTKNTPPPVAKPTQQIVSKPQQITPKPTPRPTPAKPRYTYHKVKRGDTLYGLARRYRTSTAKIQKANRLRGTVIRLGQVLKIPR